MRWNSVCRNSVNSKSKIHTDISCSSDSLTDFKSNDSKVQRIFVEFCLFGIKIGRNILMIFSFGSIFIVWCKTIGCHGSVVEIAHLIII